jgi:eukaryotic-like serine/threonine-protein kinase
MHRVSLSGTGPYRVTRELPQHLTTWQLPPDWRWGNEGLFTEHRHFQELIDALGRSLSLVTTPDPAQGAWLHAEARQLAHLSHPSIPTTFHYWTAQRETRRGPGYLRRWITGETVGARMRRLGPEDVPYALQVLRNVGSAIAYLHDTGLVHGSLSPETVWSEPTGRFWLLAWQWAVPREVVPAGLSPAGRYVPVPPEWGRELWVPSRATDQWQLAAICFALLTGELPPSRDVPPIRWVRPDCPAALAETLDRALLPAPDERHSSVAALLRAVDRIALGRTLIPSAGSANVPSSDDGEEAKLRWATEDDYEVLSSLGTGSFGSVWRVRDLALGREVALKMLHPSVASDDHAVASFRREARLAAQLAHPAIVPVYDWDSRADVSWYTMELAEGGSVADLVARSGSRPIEELAPQVDAVLDGLIAAHSVGIVHRDLKPENVLIDRYRRWRISDFGIANRAGEDHAGATGTPAFAAPEQLLGEAQGTAADLFAVAAIVAFTLTGRPPFHGTDPNQILAQQLAGTADLAGIPAPIAEWIRRGLRANADDRFPDATSMRQAWRRAVDAAVRVRDHSPWWRRLLGPDVPTPEAKRPS